MQIWFTRFNAPWKLFAHLWLSANTPSQLSRTIYLRSLVLSFIVCTCLRAVGKIAQCKSSNSENLTLLRSFALECFWIRCIPSTAITKSINDSDYKRIQTSALCMQFASSSEFFLPFSRWFVEFLFQNLCSTQGNSTLHTLCYTLCCTRRERVWMWVWVSVYLYNAQWQHDKWIRNLIFLHAVYYHQSFHFQFQFVLFVLKRKTFVKLCWTYIL